MGFALTKEQQAVVDNRGGSLLVAAAAGSGKTRVLVERLLGRVEKELLDIDRFLVISFTNASAAELKSRVIEELAQRRAEQPQNAHLRRQSSLVYQAPISTIHAFCGQFLREWGHQLEVSPDFRLCDSGEADLLARFALEQVLEKEYETIEQNPQFALLVDTMGAGRDDSRLIDIVLDIRGRIQSHHNPKEWLQIHRATFQLEHITDVGETVWGELLLADAREQATYLMQRMEEALDLAQCDPIFSANYSPTIGETIEGLDQFIQECDRGWEGVRQVLPVPFTTPGRKRVKDCPEEGELVKIIRTSCKKQIETLSKRFGESSSRLLEDLSIIQPAVVALFDLVETFEVAFSAEKTRLNMLDFGDLEHLTARLLVDDRGNPTPLACQWSERYDEIMVDEYQDTNGVQNAIFSALSKEEKNLFMVGDVKQSIYRFRLADPTIFLEKYRRFVPYEVAKEGDPRKIVLAQNFRSRPEVLEGANYIFSNIMSEQFGEMDYGKEEYLYVGRTCPTPPDPKTYGLELDVLDLGSEGWSQDQEDIDSDKDKKEAQFVAQRMSQMLSEGLLIPTSQGERPVQPSDMVILLRSPGGVLHHYIKALEEHNIPYEAQGGNGFFQRTEISVALSLLEMIDNPRQDIPLISALRSPVYGFTEDRLAQVRGLVKEGDLYHALTVASEQGWEDCQEFLQELENLRFEAGDKSCGRLLWHLYHHTNLLGLFGSWPDGTGRQRNLLLLVQLAESFEERGHKGLFGFLAYLSRLQKHGAKFDVPAPTTTGGGVRMMSIHGSKGLEFPVVFLCGLARNFNLQDLKKTILFHPKLGVGPKGLDVERMVEYPTLARRGVARQMEYELLAEEVRLLYVAMTRAREKLVMVCGLTKGERMVGNLALQASCPVHPRVLLGCRAMSDWVLSTALPRPEGGVLRQRGGVAVEIPQVPFGPVWDIRWVGESHWTDTHEAPVPQEEQEGGQVPLAPQWVEHITWSYPHMSQVDTPSQVTATQLKGRNLDEEVTSETTQTTKAQTTKTFRRPQFAQTAFGLTPAQRGTAHHLVMQFMDFDKGEQVEDVRQEINRLVEGAYITKEEGEAVSPEKIVAFFQSDLGQKMRKSPSLRREFKFSMLVPACRYFPEIPKGEEILLQGVVDAFFEEDGQLVIIDFKSDQVSSSTVHQRANHYKPQLETYGHALEEITGKKVKAKILWFFATNQQIICDTKK